MRRSAPYPFKAAAIVLCREEAESLPTTSETVACPQNRVLGNDAELGLEAFYADALEDL